ncbi:high osmolarity signaling protein SHO1 [Emergomyces africanus]|uniref:High osmolarity signaling protein SHO1 n=1 Tax=Emergomyces africanus TaxID=1955775 RepID=A0A1B7NLC8_9EURO|nr:high osmolarity signaling protein SHO1 [Emergomyces africanus]
MAHFDFNNIVGEPFALITISTSLIAWLLSFVTCVISDIQGPFPNFAWWAVGYMLCAIIGISMVLGSRTNHVYGVAIVGYLAAGLTFTTLAVNSLIYDDQASKQAAAAGFILQSMVIIVWIFYFGSSGPSSPRTYGKEHHHSYRSSKPMSNTYGARPETTISGSHPPQMYTSAQLNGFETSSPISGYPPTTANGDNPNSGTQNRFGGPTIGSQSNLGAGSTAAGGVGVGDHPSTPNEVSQPTEYPYRAKAIYSYEANPDDANEISFAKHEILDVSDVSGRWWQAKKASGETGIAPSNYLILI